MFSIYVIRNQEILIKTTGDLNKVIDFATVFMNTSITWLEDRVVVRVAA